VASDNNPLAHIHDLVEEERELRARLQNHETSPEEEHARLRALEVELDQCWDLLRQRRARREFGENPEEATARPVGEVEGYMQ
jgi:predicted nuclease with TOPRIM domain